MYQNIHINKKDWVVYLWDDIKGFSQFPYIKYAYKKQEGGTDRSIYGDQLVKIYDYNNNSELFESDVPPETRVLLDLYDDSDEISQGHRIGVIDIEVSSYGGFPTVDLASKEITAITLYDSLTSKYITFTLSENDKISNKKTDEWELNFYDNEDNLLISFLDKWQELGFTIVTGWNINDNGTINGGFDMPYLYNRIKKILGANVAKHLSPIGSCYINPFKKSLVIGGISLLDYLLLYKKFTNKMEPSYSLGKIGKKVVGIEKVSYEGSLDDLRTNNIEKFIEYNVNDVKIVVEIDKKFKFIDLARRICHVGHVPYDNFHMSSRYLDGAILMFLKRNGGLISPNKPKEGNEEYEDGGNEEEGFSGAFVKEPIPGKYNWVFDLDLTSMYPNIIISLNISPETKVGKVTKVLMDNEKLIKKRKELIDENNEKNNPLKDDDLDMWLIKKMSEFDMNYHVRNNILTYNLGSVPYSHDDFKKLIEESNYSLSSNGILYRQDKMGVIPTILSRWFGQRKDMRKQAKKCRESGDMEGYFFNDQRQKVWKILLNSAYGVLGLPIFRFYDTDNAEAVTTSGVDIIKTTGKVINDYYKRKLGKKYRIVYNDNTFEIVYENQLKSTDTGEKIKNIIHT